MTAQPARPAALPQLSPSASIWLDGLRFAAAEVVLLGHAFDFFGWHSSLDQGSPLQIQRLAVSLFFLLSGFLIPYSVAGKRASDLTEGTPPRSRDQYRFKHYFIDRASRIYVGLIPALLFIAVIDALPFHAFETTYPPVAGSGSAWTWIANLLHLQEHPLAALGGNPVPIFGSGDPLWSLAVEWWIYLAFGLLVFRPRSPIALLLGILAVTSVAFNLVSGTGDGIAGVWVLGYVAFQIWRTLVPAISTVPLTTQHRFRWLGYVIALICAILAGAVAFHWPEHSHFGLDWPFALFAALSMIALLVAAQVPTIRTASSGAAAQALRGGAAFSYTLYLTHFSVLTVLFEIRDQAHPGALVLLACVTANLAAWTVSLIGERHTKKLRRWLKQHLS